MAVKDWSTTAADNDDADATINWLEGMAPSAVNDSARAMMAALAAWYALIDAGTVSGGSVAGSADAITLTCSPTVSALAAGQRYLFKYTAAGNSGAVTLNVDGLGATALRYKDVALVSGDIATNDWVLAVYDGTRFQMLNPPRLSWAATDVPTDTSGGDVADLFLFADASQSNALNRVTVQKLLDNALTSLTADTTPDVADSLLTYDASANAAKSTTASNFYKTINTLTEDTTPDGANDLVVTYDNSASGPKKVKPQSFAATQAQQETGSAITNFVTPGRQHFHQSAAKMWVKSIVTAGVPSSPGDASYNITSVADTGPGRATFTIANDFSSANWACLITPEEAGSLGENIIAIASGTQAAGTVELNFQSETGSFNDPDSWHMVGFGDL